MPFAPFFTLLPEVASRETRTATPSGPPGAGRETFSFVEMFCNEPGCDCRRVVFYVVSEDQVRKGNLDEPLATITFGWEPRSFYRKWASFPLSDEDLRELTGPALMRLAPQSDRAEEMLGYARLLLSDAGYVERVVRHYGMFREMVDRGAGAKGSVSGGRIRGWRSPSKKRRPRRPGTR
jgi:hypothetical protein